MSASREKKRRQSVAPAERAVSADQQAAAAKRKTILYTAIGVVVAILVAALLIWDSGMIQRNITALTVGDTDYSAAEVSFYYNEAFQETYFYAQYGLNSYDIYQSPETQVYSIDPVTTQATTYHDYFMDTAIEVLTEITGLYNAAIAAGYTEADVSESVEANIESLRQSAASDSNYSSLGQMLTSYYGKLVDLSVYRKIVTRQALASLYLTDWEEKLEIGDDQLAAYYEENADQLDSFEYSSLYFTPATVPTTREDGTELTDEELAAAKEEALADAKEKADEVAALLEDMPAASRLEGAETLAEEHEPTSSSIGNVTTGSTLSSIFSEWMLDEARQPGDVGVVPYEDYGYYVLVFHDRFQETSVQVRHILIQAELDEGAALPTEEQLAAAKSEAEALLAEWEAGEATEESFAALANTHSSDTGSNTNGGLYEQVFRGDFVTNFNDWLFGERGVRRPGDTAVLENTGSSASYHGYHIVYFVGENTDDFAWEVTAGDTLRTEASTAHLEELTSPLTVTEQSGMSYVG